MCDSSNERAMRAAYSSYETAEPFALLTSCEALLFAPLDSVAKCDLLIESRSTASLNVNVNVNADVFFDGTMRKSNVTN